MVGRDVIIQIFLKVVQPLTHDEWTPIDTFHVFMGRFVSLIFLFAIECHLTNWTLKLFGMGNRHMLTILGPFQEVFIAFVALGSLMSGFLVTSKLLWICETLVTNWTHMWLV